MLVLVGTLRRVWKHWIHVHFVQHGQLVSRYCNLVGDTHLSMASLTWAVGEIIPSILPGPKALPTAPLVDAIYLLGASGSVGPLQECACSCYCGDDGEKESSASSR